MKRVQLSGAEKRKLSKRKQEKAANIVSKTPKLTHFFTQGPQHDIPIQTQSSSSEKDTTTFNSSVSQTQAGTSTSSLQILCSNFISPVNYPLDACAENVDSKVETTTETESLVNLDHDCEMIQSTKYVVNLGKDPGLWLDLSADDVAYWIARGPSDCQHHNGPFDKSFRHFNSDKHGRYCSQKLFVGTKANGENFKREWLLYSPSIGSVYCFVCKLFSYKKSSRFVTREGFSDWRNTIRIDNHERSGTHRDCMLTYLTSRQGMGLTQQLEKQIQEERDYWENVLKRVIAVIRTLAERGLAFRGREERFESLQNGNFLGLLELIAQFDPFLAGHISKYGNSGKGNPSYLSKTTCEELIQLMAQMVHAHIVDEVKSSGYFSLSVDSTPDLSHVDQLSVVLRYLKNGEPIERFLTFLDMKSHTGGEMANQVLDYLREDCQLNFSKCRGQSYDNASNMSGRYKGMQQKIMETNKFAIYVPCAAHSLNLVGRSAVDCCQEAVNFFSIVQSLYNFFSASTSRWKILKRCIGNDSVLKSLSDTRWDAHAVATAAILKSYSKILEALDCITEDQYQKGDTIREANNIANKMQKLEFVFMLNFWNEILQNFHKVSQVLQSADVNLQTCADLYESLGDQLCTSRDHFEKYEAATKEMLPDVDYKLTRIRHRKKVPNDGDGPEVHLNARDKFRINTYYSIIDTLQTEMRRRGEVYKVIAERFSILNDVPQNITLSSSESDRYFQGCEKLINAYPEDFNNDLTAELQQFHSYVRHKLSATKTVKTKFTHAELYKIIVEDNIQCAFPNVDIGFRIFLTLMITNCSAERSFSQLKYIKNLNRTMMRQGRLDALSLLSIEADVLREICFEDVIRDFAGRKCRRKLVSNK